MYGLDDANEAVDLRSTQSTPDWKDRDGPQDLLRRRSHISFPRSPPRQSSLHWHRLEQVLSARVMWTDMDAKGGPRMCRPDGLLKGPDGFATTWAPQKSACINTTTQNHCYRYYHRNHANHKNRHPEPLSFKPFFGGSLFCQPRRSRTLTQWDPATQTPDATCAAIFSAMSHTGPGCQKRQKGGGGGASSALTARVKQ